ncbi:hypothetical protein GCM10012285_50870 [Streptomyces kronopolitis]|uniref:Uncharacterized protein n=1 Tax=Streptomyces kronopolitis TaxID=1612435 RepID=A0ABQ2JUV6_9ACTN|nr:hypothetical protein [Streptomyces kronopolitis]GGN56337.1 hypothetical protein GCM10012285_50870 [Streptomyces kronopolitis]
MTALSVEQPRPHPTPSGRRRVLLAPITVTPSKPLTPSHLKGLLWTDVMYRATQSLADVTYRYSHTTYHPTEQTLGFWEFLDRTRGDTGYDELTEDRIGELYVDFRAAQRAPVQALRPYAEAAERGWVHPASARVLRLWSEHYAALGLHDPGLLLHQPPGFTLDAALDRLTDLGICLDHRAVGGPVYLDLTRFGLPLRQLVTADGRPNYLACALRELLPLAVDFDEVVLLYDSELAPDYQQLERVLTALGPSVRRVSLGRVPIDGKIRSARQGGWRDVHAGALLRTVCGEHDAAAVRLGMRLYFIAMLGPGRQQSFRADLLHQSLKRAEQLLASAPQKPPRPLAERLAQHRKDHLYIDPYRLTSGLLGKRRAAPASDLLTTVFS